MKPQIVIIGSGLGGCFLAAGLIEHCNVTIIELSDRPPLLRDRVTDVAKAAVTYPHIESGLGGTTKAWHNALMEIDATVFDRKWPFSKDVIAPYYERAYKVLSGTTRDNVIKYANQLKKKLKDMGFPEPLLKHNMFIPKVRINAWNALKLNAKVTVVEGEVIELIPNDGGGIGKVKILRNDGAYVFAVADYFVLAAGGLGSPLLLQKLAKSLPLAGLKHAGLHYEDHPVAVVGEVELVKPFYKLWNFPVTNRSGDANIRIPLSIYLNDLNISFQFRPAHHLRLSKPRTKIITVLNELRNSPFKLAHYWRLLTLVDDIFEILSFKFGIRIPTCSYSVLMVAEQPPATQCAVWREEGITTIYRRWRIDATYISKLDEAISSFLKTIQPLTKRINLFPSWSNEIFSSSHHSGTARLSNTPDHGVCDINGKVHGLSNLFVCDGSLIPGSGFVNTGLTIVAMAIRMSDFILETVLNGSNAE